MANANKVSGFTPVKYQNGADWDGRVNTYWIPTSDANVLSPGDPVKLSGTGDPTGQFPAAILATANVAFVGVIVAVGVNPYGPYINPANLDLTQAPATKTVGYYAAVVDDPMVIFEAQEAGASSNLAVTNIGENIDFVYAAPATGQRYSGVYIDNATHDTTVTRTFKLLRLAPRIDNVLGAFAKWYVLPNNHSYRVGSVGI